MLLIILAFLGGVLTIASPCILPVLPFVFARADRPFARSGLPLLAGMAITFAAVATLAAFGGGWVVRANQYGRVAALVVLAIVGASLVSERFAAWLARPAVALGQRLSRSGGDGIAGSFALGVATGLLWAPCAGPILGLILAGAALGGAGIHTTLLLLAYAAGAATSLAAALLVGGRLFQWMKRRLGAGEWLRRGIGVVVLIAVIAVATGLDTGLVARTSLAGGSAIEQRLVDALTPAPANATPPGTIDPARMLPVEGELPSLTGATHWFNSAPLSPVALRGKVVLVDFWTYSCINCIRTLPYVTAWNRKYHDHGLVIIGVHTPEFAFEKDPANVARALKRFGIGYPVAMDDDYAIWAAFHNRYWPADYFIDAQGRIRGHHFGEGGYHEAEDLIRRLLTAAGKTNLPGGYVDPAAHGAEAASTTLFRSPETYVGYARAENFAGGALIHNFATDYDGPEHLDRNEWALDGRWKVGPQQAQLVSAGGRIRYRFHGRDLHLVLGPASDGKPVHFHVTIDGHAPGADHGGDIDAAGAGVVDRQRLYQLVRQAHGRDWREVTITFDQPGVEVYAFTFG